MKNKVAVLSGMFVLKIINGFPQSPERMQNKSLSNLKEPLEKAMALYNMAYDHFDKKEYAQVIHI